MIAELDLRSYPKRQELIFECCKGVYACQAVRSLGNCCHTEVSDFLVVSKVSSDSIVARLSFLGLIDHLLEFVRESSSGFHRCVAACTHVRGHLVNPVTYTRNTTPGPSLHLCLFCGHESIGIPVVPKAIESQLWGNMEVLDLPSEGFSIGLGVSWELVGFVCGMISNRTTQDVCLYRRVWLVSDFDQNGQTGDEPGLYVLLKSTCEKSV